MFFKFNVFIISKGFSLTFRCVTFSKEQKIFLYFCFDDMVSIVWQYTRKGSGFLNVGIVLFGGIKIMLL